MQQEHHVQFFTAVCKDWLPLLADAEAKHIVLDALRFRVKAKQVKICCIVIMPVAVGRRPTVLLNLV